jgi:hypothetical protein
MERLAVLRNTTMSKTFWIAKLRWRISLRCGHSKRNVLEPEAMTYVRCFLLSGNMCGGFKLKSLRPKQVLMVKKVDLIIYEKVGIGRGGAWSNNPWLQEMPDPVTKCTWDNYVLMSPNRAKKMGAEHTDLNEVVCDTKRYSASKQMVQRASVTSVGTAWYARRCGGHGRRLWSRQRCW